MQAEVPQVEFAHNHAVTRSTGFMSPIPLRPVLTIRRIPICTSAHTHIHAHLGRSFVNTKNMFTCMDSKNIWTVYFHHPRVKIRVLGSRRHMSFQSLPCSVLSVPERPHWLVGPSEQGPPSLHNRWFGCQVVQHPSADSLKVDKRARRRQGAGWPQAA